MYFESLCDDFKKLPEVEAIALGGSRAGNHFDEKSDYDLYIYYTSLVPKESIRKDILEKHCQYIEIGNSFWELEDDCTLKDKIDIDILYRNINDFSQAISSVVENHCASNGYTTCMWHNLLNSKILYDKHGKLEELKKQYDVEYPEELKNNIIRRNIRLLTGNLPSYDLQIKKALKRNDILSINHRTAAFMESYFDIIFAMNKMTHPGEKRMLSIAIEKASVLPENFENNIICLYEDLFSNPERVMLDIKALIENLQKCLDINCL